MDIKEMLTYAKNKNASDIFIIAGLAMSYKSMNQIHPIHDEILKPDDTYKIICEIYKLANNRSIDHFLENGDDDFSFSIPGVSRFRVNTYKQRGSLAAVIRIITFDLPDPAKLHIPQEIIELADVQKGLILVTGPAGSGKTTTLSCLIDHINKTQNKHIITLEDPIEYLHSHQQSIVSQREISIDTESYVTALRASLRQSPDVILLGEMRDYETMNVAITAAETGHTVISTLHTIGTAKTIDRIIDVFPSSQQHQIAVQLSLTLHAVVSQQLVPAIDGTLIPAFEVMTMTPAIRNLIRENKIHQIDGIITSSYKQNMISMDTSLYQLYKQNIITDKTALNYATNPEVMKRKLNL